MKTYKSHKKVDAAQILVATFTQPENSTERTFTVALNDGTKRELDPKVTARYQPKEGDYLVVYDAGTADEYVSISPKAKFEGGYTEYHGEEAYIPQAPDPVAIQLVDSALKGISKGQMDTGGGFGCRDYWATILGVEYFISMQRSKRQNMLDQGIRLPPTEKLLGKDTSIA